MRNLYDKYNLDNPQEAINTNNQNMVNSKIFGNFIYYFVLIIMSVFITGSNKDSRKWLISTMIISFIIEINYYINDILYIYDIFDIISDTITVYERVQYIK